MFNGLSQEGIVNLSEDRGNWPPFVALRKAQSPTCSGRIREILCLKLTIPLRVNRKTVTLWRERFVWEGLDGLWEVAPGRGRESTYGAKKIEAIVDATLRTKPKGMSQWSCRLLASSQGVSKSTINNIWQSHNLKPHRVKKFKLSRDARFLEKLTDVVGLYLNPPQQAMVLCLDEKSQIQALDRTEPVCH